MKYNTVALGRQCVFCIFFHKAKKANSYNNSLYLLILIINILSSVITGFLIRHSHSFQEGIEGGFQGVWGGGFYHPLIASEINFQ